MLPFPESEQLTIGENVLSLTTLPILSRISYQLLFEISLIAFSCTYTFLTYPYCGFSRSMENLQRATEEQAESFIVYMAYGNISLTETVPILPEFV